jgi:hypothetical protein
VSFKKKTASEIADAAFATSRALRDFYEGGKWAPGGVEYQGPFKLAMDLPTNVKDRVPMAIGRIIGAPKPKMPKLPPVKAPESYKTPETPKPPKPPSYNKKKTASEIADMVIQKTAQYYG